jgi:MoaA/NifB/PqqE/SkfB family radical SAM enzyme
MCFWSDPVTARHLVKNNPVMPIDLFTRLLDEVTPHCSSISLTDSGEFLSDPLREERFEILGRHLRKHPDLQYVQISNGSMLNGTNLDYLKEAPDVTFAISLDTTDYLEYEFIRRPGVLSIVEENLILLRAALSKLGVKKITLIINVVLMKCNVFSLLDVIRLARAVGASVYCDHVAKLNDKLSAESLFHFPALANMLIERCEALAAKLRVPFNRPPPFALTPPQAAEKAQEPHSKTCPQLNETGPIHIEANGNVIPCCPPSPLVVGNVYEESFEQIIFGKKIEEYRAAILQGKPLPPCDCCQRLHRKNNYLYDSAAYGWDIPAESRNNEIAPDLIKHGFFDWLNDISGARLKKSIVTEYAYRRSMLLRNNDAFDSLENEMQKVSFANDVMMKYLKANSSVTIYGAGIDSVWLMKNTIAKHLRIIAFADRDSEKQGRKHFEIDIIRPELISSDAVLIASERHGADIQRSLAAIIPNGTDVLSVFQ